MVVSSRSFHTAVFTQYFGLHVPDPNDGALWADRSSALPAASIVVELSIPVLPPGSWTTGYRPCSRRLYSCVNPSASQYNALIQSVRFQQTRKGLFVYGFSPNVAFPSEAIRSTLLRRYMHLHAIYTCSALIRSSMVFHVS